MIESKIYFEIVINNIFFIQKVDILGNDYKYFIKKNKFSNLNDIESNQLT
jgi:hypothetical protein